MFIYKPVDRAISAFLRTIFSSTGSGIYMTFLFSKLETITSVEGGGIAVVYCPPAPGVTL